ncbi:MAG: TfuA-related McrA-glycine thioamidation protein [Methanomassiliicoccales archaeon]|nr:TfuA-related McrA-glycine thioamidation protein [Methanomassiliicoccales archaeon]
MSTVIFLGPSLPRAEAARLLEADYRPPVKRGDLPFLGGEVEAVGIIDGVFMSDSSVGHREILSLIDRGVRVVGGGSMGALRASELHDLGMEGVGEIYELYASGEVEGDDEVALTFHPETFEPLSEPLVNVRLNLRNATEIGLLSDGEASSILERVRSEYFPRRSIELLMRVADDVSKGAKRAKLRAFFRENYVDYKRIDAVAVIKSLTPRTKGADD